MHFFPGPYSIRHRDAPPLKKDVLPLLTYTSHKTIVLGDTLSGVSNTVGGVVGGAGRGLGETVSGVTGQAGKPLGDGISNVGTAVQGTGEDVGKATRDAGHWKSN